VSDADIDEAEGSSIPGGEEPGKGTPGGDTSRPSGSSPYRKPALAVARAVVVLAIAAVGYQEVIPQHPVIRSRLGQLVIAQPGVAGFKAKPSTKGEQPVSDVNVAALTSAQKESPNETGLYTVGWPATKKGSTDVVGVIAFLLPSNRQAQTVLQQVNTNLLSANSQSANSMVRTRTFTIPGVPTSSGSRFEPKKKTKTSQDVALTSFRQGRVVAVTEAIKTTETAAGAAAVQSLATDIGGSEQRHLAAVTPHFTLTVTRHPTVASVVWIAGSVIVAILAAIGPVLFGVARRRRRARLQAELDRLIVVRGQTITKRRR
jgi:hypothetical protein